MVGRTSPFAHKVPIKNVIPTTRSGTRGAQLNIASLTGTTATFAAALTKDTLVPLAAITASFAGILVKKTLIPLTAMTTSFAGTLVKKTLASLAAATTVFASTITKKTEILLAGSITSFAAAINGVVVFTISFSATTAAFSATLVKKTLVPLSSATASYAGILVKKTLVPLAAAKAAFAGVLVKKTLIPLAGATASLAGTLVKKTLIPLAAATASFAGAIAKKTLISLAAIKAAFAGVIAKKTFIPLAGTAAAFIGSIQKLTAISIQAGTTAFSAAISESSGGGGTTFYQVFNAALTSFVAMLSVVKIFGSASTVANSGLSPNNPAMIQVGSAAGMTLFRNTQIVPNLAKLDGNSPQDQFSLGSKAMGGYLLQGIGNSFSPGLYSNSYLVVASGNVTIPVSAINAGLNLALNANYFWSEGRVVGISTLTIGTLTEAIVMPPGIYSWAMTCWMQSDRGGGMKPGPWTIAINGIMKTGQGRSIPYSQLNLSLGASFTGTVSGSDQFQISCLQFALQQ